MKSAMSGQPISLAHRLRSAVAIWRFYKAGVFHNASREIALHHELQHDIEEYAGEGTKRILDVGCGQIPSQVLLFQSEGVNAFGIDVEISTYRLNLKTFRNVAKANGLERSIKSLVRALLFDRSYLKDLERHFGRPLRLDLLDQRVFLMSAEKMLFPDNHFDFVYSHWAFEHIPDVMAAISEINRVLRPNGMARVAVHLFPSLSGGHCLEWYPGQPLSKTVPPWDHLRDCRFPVNTFLNRLKLADYERGFSSLMQIMRTETTREDPGVLTPALEKELGAKGYSRDDLLTSLVVFYCRKI